MSDLRYSIDETPQTKFIPLFGLQHLLTMLGATVAVPTIVASAFGLSSNETSLLISNVLIAMGVATLLQVYVGTKLPIIQGSSFAFLPAFLYVATTHSGPEGLSYAAGAFILGAILQMFLGFSGVAGLLQRILTPVIVGPTIMMIGLSLFNVGGAQASQNWLLSGATILLVLLFSFGFSRFTTKMEGSIFSRVSTFPVILAIVVIWSVCVFFSLTGILTIDIPGYVDLSGVFANNSIDLSRHFLPWGYPKFDFTFLLIFAIAYLVSTIESVGDYNAINELSHRETTPLSAGAVNNGIFSEGLGCLLAGLFGANPTTSYSENIGLVGITRVASRVVVATAGALLIIAGLLPFIGALLATIPTPVMGGLYCVLFGMIAGVGLRYAARADLHSMRNISIIGFTLFFGFAVPSVFAAPDAKEIVAILLGQGLADVVLGIVTSSMAVTAISGLLLDNLLSKE